MARNALEAVFGALGGGLVGYGKDKQNRYGQEQEAIEREERRKRTELADALKAADMLESGNWGTEAQLQSRQGDAGRTAMRAAMFAATRGAGPAPMPTDVARAVPQLRRGMDAPRVSVGGQDLRLLETASDRLQAARAGRMEDAAVARQQERADAKEDAERKLKNDVTVTGIKTAAEANAALRSRRTSANAEFLRRYSQGKMVPGPYESSPQVKVPLSADEVKALRREVYESYGITPEGSVLPAGSAAPIVVTGEQTANEQTLTRRRDEAIAAVDARLISTAQKARAKARIEAAYQSDLEKLGPRR